MEQSELRQWERQCVQEEVPPCTAACPLHVDARTFCSLMAQRRWDKAWQILAKTMPLPGVLARFCDGPCKGTCVRKDAGGAIEMEFLERFCAENAKPVAPPRPLPSRGKTVAVLGGGMTGLCATWELVRRGFDVTLYCSSLGGSLLDYSGDILPEGVLEREIESLRTMGATIEAGVDILLVQLDLLLDEKDAVFVDSDAVSTDLFPIGMLDEMTLGTQRAGLFASRSGEVSFILQAATGRRAANSIERYTQGVSMVTGRELEGPYETRLFTSLEKIESVSPVLDKAYSELTAQDEAKRCLQCECMECVKGCEYLRHFKYYPKVYVRQIYNNDSIVMGTRQANTMINSCMLCGQCEIICPEDFSMADVCLEARRGMVAQGKMPPSAHEFALRDMAFANGAQSALARHAPGADISEYVFFPGCQLTASDPEGVLAAYDDLCRRLGSVGLMLHCCGIPAEWSGQQALMEESMEVLREKWQALGGPKIIVACPTCLKTLREGLPDAAIVSHWAILRALGLPAGAKVQDISLAINDPCAARNDVLLREDVRSLLDSLHIDVKEPEYSGEKTPCCGYGGLLSTANPALGEAVARARGEAVEEDYVTYCVMCRDMLAKIGKRAVHLYDLLYPGNDDPGVRPAPGYSVRRENRVYLKERLLRELWCEDGANAKQPYEDIGVEFTEQARSAMEDRRILKSDVQKVLLQANTSGCHLVNDKTGHKLASFRPVVVTYWVEYEDRGTEFIVHNTWCHRMHIKGAQQ
ncbi:MAG: 4Fe-4S dicluster domain-containing protein [Pseudodesulfovibrio sp.]|nr:4Fe-4S dicluster domain-containing protein [Pseudodesulfovibrio sp.]